jgi:hypothetical protein
MKLKMVALLAFLFNAFLFGTYYAVAKDALERIDPIVFTFFTMMALVPVALRSNITAPPVPLFFPLSTAFWPLPASASFCVNRLGRQPGWLASFRLGELCS